MKAQSLSIHISLDACEQAIEKLFEAIASTAPSTAKGSQSSLNEAIDELILQNEALSPALDEGKQPCCQTLTRTDPPVYQHQQNSIRIRALQQESISLDESLREIMASMAHAHKDLIASTKKTSRDPILLHETVDYDMLIRYAERIAKFTARPVTSTIQHGTTFSAQNLPWPTVITFHNIFLEVVTELGRHDASWSLGYWCNQHGETHRST